MWKKVRIGLLLYVLVMVAAGAWLSRARTTDWSDTLWVTIHPINGDGSGPVAEYIRELSGDEFRSITEFFIEEANYHELALSTPVRIELAGEVTAQPPLPPGSANPVLVAFWSLRLRYWAFSVEKHSSTPADVDVFVRYFDPDDTPRLAHSLGLQKGLIGVVNAYASAVYGGSNNVVIAHELLHTLGATDKYDRETSEPLFPEGYADPLAEPLYPQQLAEVMAGRTPVSANESTMPTSLRTVVMGDETAREIGFVSRD